MKEGEDQLSGQHTPEAGPDPGPGIPKNTKARRTSRETRLWRKVTEVFPRPFNTLPMVVDR